MTSLSVGGNTLWGLGDHLGTPRDIADLNEGTSVTSVTNHRTYNGFGKLTAETNSAVDMLFGYTGKQLDEATGLQHNLNRWYDSNLGQWLNEDPIGFDAGDVNTRRYVSNGSLHLVDPLGLDEGGIIDWIISVFYLDQETVDGAIAIGNIPDNYDITRQRKTVRLRQMAEPN